ncbi:MAG: hypothetical protein RLY86_1856 [Pseudomonadota bacterium]|jgi:DNA-binding transcriptional LysR family regulator
MPTPDLADLDAFTAVARARSFRGAATARGVSPSALSAAVRRVEEGLGMRLLTRTTRSVTVTEAGRRLLERLQPALADVAAAVAAIGDGGDRIVGRLRLNVPVIVAKLVLPDLLPRFLAAHPGITVEVVADNRFVDVLADGFDAGIRYGEHLAQDMVAIPIGPQVQRYVTAASPAYLAQRGIPDTPQAVLAHDCIVQRFPSGALAAWEFERGEEAVKVAPPARLVADTLDLQVAVALAGTGLIHTFDGMLAPHLAAGTLRQVLADWSPAFPGPYLYFVGGRHVPAPLRAFIDAVKRAPDRG